MFIHDDLVNQNTFILEFKPMTFASAVLYQLLEHN